MERAGAEELELSAELMWDPEEEEDPQYQNLPADDSAVSRSTRSHRPELLQGIP
jgi:hypothetical protein